MIQQTSAPRIANEGRVRRCSPTTHTAQHASRASATLLPDYFNLPLPIFLSCSERLIVEMRVQSNWDLHPSDSFIPLSLHTVAHPFGVGASPMWLNWPDNWFLESTAIELITGSGAFKSKHSLACVISGISVYKPSAVLFLTPDLTGSEEPLCSQSHQGGLHVTTAPAGVERRVVQAKKGWVRDPHFMLSLSARSCPNHHNAALHLSLAEPLRQPVWKRRRQKKE